MKSTVFRQLLLAVIVVCCIVVDTGRASPLDGGPWGKPHDPVANQDAVVEVGGSLAHHGGGVRFTVLTSRLIRVERKTRSETSWEDCKTVAFLNRRLPVPWYLVANDESGGLVLQTEHLTLTYQPKVDDNDGNVFTQDILSVTGRLSNENAFNNKNKNNWTWYYGDVDSQNLLGTIRTLDGLTVVSLNCTEHAPEAHCEYGLVSRSGYAIVNDTNNWCLRSSDDWWDGPNRDLEDFYIFGYGHDYKAALQDYALVGGRIPLLPRYALGIWYSRWYDYSPADIIDEVARYEQRSIPLDVFVLDMNWHSKNNWTGFSWDSRLFQQAQDSLAYLKHRGLAVTLNLHDANGVGSWELQYNELCDALGLDASKGEAVEVTIVNQTVMLAVDDLVLHPLQEQGVDFWWIDWQQGEAGPGGSVGGKMNPTIWTAHVRSTQPNRMLEDRRTMVLARWGGLGAHRYPVHFSGDVDEMSWDTLAFQVYFSMTATNTLAIWSHDTHAPNNNPELYTRFVQWSAFSGIARAHERGWSAGECVRQDFDRVCTIVEPWNVPTKFAEANYDALRTRAKLLPYIYTAAHRAHETGLQIMIPMYYEWPELDEAYETAKLKPEDSSKFCSQYLFGNDIWVAPVVRPADKRDGLSRLTLWIPPGVWIGLRGGRVLSGAEDGSTSIAAALDLHEIPLFARAGAVIPTRPDVRPGHTVGLASIPYEEIEWVVCLSRGAPIAGSGFLYEDDGYTLAYTKGVFTLTTANYTIVPSEQDADRSHVAISFTTSGLTGDGFSKIRTTSFRLMNTLPPYSVKYNNGTYIPFSRFGGKGTWSYDSKDSAVVVELLASPIVVGVTTTIIVETRTTGQIAEALDGAAFKIGRAGSAKASLDEARIAPGSQTGEANSAGALLSASSIGASLEYLAGHSLNNFDKAVLGFHALYAAAREEVADMVKASESAFTTSGRNYRFLNSEEPPRRSSAAPEIQYRITRALALLDTASLVDF